MRAQLTLSLRRILVADALITGAGYAFGPASWHSSSSFSVIVQYGLPWPVWGGAFMVGGIALLAVSAPRYVVLSHGFLAMLYLIWGGSLFASSLTGELTAWGGPWHVIAIAAIHLVALWRARRALMPPSGR